MAGCVHLPPEVAREVAPADGSTPNHFEWHGAPLPTPEDVWD